MSAGVESSTMSQSSLPDQSASINTVPNSSSLPFITQSGLEQYCTADTAINFLSVLLTCLSFQLFAVCVDRWNTPAHLFSSSPSLSSSSSSSSSSRSSAKSSSSGKKQWRWKNTFVSLVHSAISGIWAVSCFYREPKMATDMISTFIPDARFLIAFSVGYFLHDTIDMLRYNPGRQSYELMVHHTVIFMCFGVSLCTQLFLSYATVALVIEINSIFLHIRLLMQIYGISKEHPVARCNSMFNFGSFILFRLVTMAWMSRWLLINKDHPLVTLPLYSLGSVGLAVMTIINIILFYRLLESDLLKSRKQQTQKTD